MGVAKLYRWRARKCGSHCGDKEFVQRDVTQAYTQFKQQYADVQIPEQILKTQAIEKLIRDELLLQHVTAENLTVSDERVREFIAALQYFQRDGKFDKSNMRRCLVSRGCRRHSL